MATTPNSLPEVVKKNATVYTKDTLEKKVIEISFPHKDSASVEDAIERLNSYGDEGKERLLTVLNNTLTYFSAREARVSAMAQFVGKKGLFAVLKPFRAFPNYSTFPDTKEGYAAQTEAILATIRATPGMLAMIVSNVADDGSEDESGAES